MESAVPLSAVADGRSVRLPTAADIVIRSLSTTEDFHACVDLQRDVWGRDQPEVVPATLLHVVGYVGGLVAGAFDPDGALLGFVFGITGPRDGTLVHWSHQLGVRETARNIGIGRMLKEFQRQALATLGVARIYWSFDPLMAKNAYLNLNRLGATVAEYMPDMYGTTESPLHLGMATDRLVVSLDTAGVAAPPQPMLIADAPVLTAFPRRDDDVLTPGDRRPPIVLIEIPPEMLEVAERAPATAHVWRMSVREYFQWALANGYSPRGIRRDFVSGRTFYVAISGRAGALPV